MRVPYVFVGCSTAALPRAEELRSAIERELGTSADIEVWRDTGAFEPGSVLIQTLQDKAQKVDFAVLVLSPVDGKIAPNVMFELGLFLGKLENYRTLIVNDGADLPTDLDGVIHLDLSTGVDKVSEQIVRRIRQYGRRVTREVELGSLERMLNVCTPGYDDYETPHLTQVKKNVNESFNSADDFDELCQCLLYRYVVGSMEPKDAEQLRVYFAMYIGDGIEVNTDDGKVTVHRCRSLDESSSDADASFMIAMSNPRRRADIDNGFALGEVLAPDWRVGMPLEGYKRGDPQRPASTCARVFQEQIDHVARRNESTNRSIPDETEVYAVPVLWKEGKHTASVGILGLSADNEGLQDHHKPMMRRLQLVGNVLGVAANRLSHELSPSVPTAVGVAVDETAELASFSRRAVALRQTIGEHAVERLLRHDTLTIVDDGNEPVLARVTADD